jgi:hypothetical protein
MILSHSGFQPLQEVWLGDCYPSSWYDHGFDGRSRDILQKITEMTKTDLDKFARVLEQLGVMVRRPNFRDRNLFLDYHGNLVKPPITPRDWALTLDDTLYIIPQYLNNFTGFNDTIDTYLHANQKVKVLDRSEPDPLCYVPFPSTVRVGKDLFLDCSLQNPGYRYFQKSAEELSKKYRVHVTHTGDHNDGIFCPVRPGCIFTTHYRNDYSQTFPNWEVVRLPDTTVKRSYNGRWWVEGFDLQIFNDSVLKYAESWIGNSQETIFEVNMLVIDEKNICCITENNVACRQLERMGFTVHVIDFRCRGFWDGGLHCLTVDIHRLGDCNDYWPKRGSPGIYYYEVE